MSIFAQQRVDVCLQFRSKFNVSVLCAFTYVLLLQDCVCVCVYLTCVCQIFFLASRLQRCRCASQGETQREMQCKGVTWKESHDHVSLLEAWWIGFKQQSSHCVCRFVSVLSKKKNSTVSAFFAQCDWAIWDWEWKVFCVLYCLKLNLSNGMLLVRRIASRLFL